jgi:ABC-type polysaccharide/polyol phosphate transport system ATPase subunit
VIVAAITFADILTPLFFYVVIAAYMAFVLSSAWQFSRRTEPGRIMRAINLSLVPLGVLVALVGVTGSGKSTFAARHFRPTEVLSSDWVAPRSSLASKGS